MIKHRSILHTDGHKTWYDLVLSYGPLFYLILRRNTELPFIFLFNCEWMLDMTINEWNVCNLGTTGLALPLGTTAGWPVWSGVGSSAGWPTSTIVLPRPPVGSQGGYHNCRSRSWNHLGHGRRADQPRSHLPPPLLAHASSPSPSASSPLSPCSHTAICAKESDEMNQMTYELVHVQANDEKWDGIILGKRYDCPWDWFLSSSACSPGPQIATNGFQFRTRTAW